MQAKITKRTVDAAAATDGRDLWVWDTEVKGFGLRVRPNGRKVYIVEYRPGEGGRKAPKRRFTIGSHGSPWTPDAARDEALRVLGMVKGKHDPAAERTEARHRQSDSFADVVGDFIEKHAKRKLRSWQEMQRCFDRDIIPHFGKKAVQDVTRQDVLRLLDKRAEDAPVMANRVLAYVRKFFNWCIERGYVTASPCTGIKAPTPETSRERTLDDAELVEVWRAAEQVGGLWAPMVKLLVLTAQRRAEVSGLRWEELDLERKTWTIPAERAKNKRTHEVPLTDTAVALLKAVPRYATEEGGKVIPSRYVFTTTGKTPVSGLSKAKAALDRKILNARRKDDAEAAAIARWTYHDLRRTATTGMARLGIHPHIADAVLNHKTGSIQGVAAIYNRHAYLDERRRALEAWEAHVLGCVEGKAEADNVVALADLRGA